jgi:hypothetical protein
MEIGNWKLEIGDWRREKGRPKNRKNAKNIALFLLSPRVSIDKKCGRTLINTPKTR